MLSETNCPLNLSSILNDTILQCKEFGQIHIFAKDLHGGHVKDKINMTADWERMQAKDYRRYNGYIIQNCSKRFNA